MTPRLRAILRWHNQMIAADPLMPLPEQWRRLREACSKADLTLPTKSFEGYRTQLYRAKRAAERGDA